MLTIIARESKGTCQVTGKENVEVVTIRSGDAAEQTIAMSELTKIVRFQTPLSANRSGAAGGRNTPRAQSTSPSS